jgi:hypothetical protein
MMNEIDSMTRNDDSGCGDPKTAYAIKESLNNNKNNGAFRVGQT